MRHLPLPALLLLLLLPRAAPAAAPAAPAPDAHLSRFAAGDGPTVVDGVYRLLDSARTPGQSNAVAFDRAAEGARESFKLSFTLRVLEGGAGGAFLFLNTREYGIRGPAPFVPDWTEPNLHGSFAVGIDVFDPPTDEPFGPQGNVLGAPEREVSLHFDGREIVKRLAPAEFRGDFVDGEIGVRFVCGGAEVTVRLGEGTVYDDFFVAGMPPYECRPAIGAGTLAEATTEFDVDSLRFEAGAPATPRRPPLTFEILNHGRTDSSRTSFEKDIDLPPADWAFGRVILRLEIHDAGESWDEWDRCGEVSVIDADGTKHGIVPFITSYRTPCRWDVDVTAFRPWLAGRTRIEVAAGTRFYKNRGFVMSASLQFWPGTPELEAYRMVPLWHGTAHYGSDENHYRDFFTPQTVSIDADARAARIFLTTTGHSQVGEFTPSRRTVVFVPDRDAEEPAEERYGNVLWKTDCYLNPNRPQYGTWKYPRAGWAPGDVVRPWWIDLTPHLVPGATAELRYEPEPYDFSGAEEAPAPAEVAKANQIVRGYLILWREPERLVSPPALLVTNVAGDGNAARAGVKAGDWLVSYDGRRLETIDDLREAIEAAAKKEKVALVILRGRERIETEAGPGRLGVNLAIR